PDDLDAIELRHVQWFFQRFYTPDNAVLVVAGDFDPLAARRDIVRYFGSIRAHRFVRPSRDLQPVTLDGEYVLAMDAPVSQRIVEIYWPTPAYLEPGDAALDIVADVLNERFRERLIRAGLVLNAGARQSSLELTSEFAIRVILHPDNDENQILGIIDEELRRLQRTVLPEGDLASRRRSWRRELVRRSVSPLGDACDSQYSMTSDAARRGVGVDRYDRLTGEQVRDAALRYLPVNRRLVLLVNRNGRAELGGELQGTYLRRGAAR
ncbi:MAG: insulinase family protein, partial [Myxococcota bacterium]